jgi:hypothetical protein
MLSGARCRSRAARDRLQDRADRTRPTGVARPALVVPLWRLPRRRLKRRQFVDIARIVLNDDSRLEIRRDRLESFGRAAFSRGGLVFHGTPRSQLTRRLASSAPTCLEDSDLTTAIVPAGTSFPAVPREPFDLAIARYVATSFFDQLNSVRSIHMPCRMTASLRATATVAFRSPFRLASLIPQAAAPTISARGSAARRPLRKDNCVAWRHHTSRYVPSQSVSPEAWRRVVNPT